MTKVYISGKITGNQHYKRDFKKAKKLFPKKDFSILMPTYLDCILDYEDYMKIDFAMISVCDYILVLNNYKDSPGALREIDHAIKNGVRVVFENNIDLILKNKAVNIND